MIKTRAFARNRILEIIKEVDTFRAKQADEIAYQKRMGYALTPEKRTEMERQDRVQTAAARRRLDKLKSDYRAFIEDESLPFGIENGRIVSLTQNDKDLLESLRFMPPLRPVALQRYLEHFREVGDTAMLQALCAYATEKGYSVSGIDAVTDPDGEYKEFCTLLKKAEKVIDGASPEDDIKEMEVQIFRDELQKAWDDSLSYKQEIRVMPIIKTPEEAVLQDLETPETPETGDPIQAQHDAIAAFTGEAEAAEFLESVALAEMQERKAEKDETAETYADKAKREREELSKEMVEANGGKMVFGARK